MDRWFTPQERGVILFFVATLILGTVIYIYKFKTPYFAPELKILDAENWTELEEYEAKDSLEQLIQETDSQIRESQRAEKKNLRRMSEVGVVPTSRDKVNINIASEQELISLPGIGPVLAKLIIEYRERSGGFKKPEDIIKVRGIGQKKFETLKDKITI